MTLHAFLTQVGALLVIGSLAVLAFRMMNRRQPTRRPSSPAKPRPITRLLVDERWTLEQCAEVFETLTEGQALHFFAADVPSPSDPGGYVTAMRNTAGNLTRWVGNHGWSSALREVSLTELQDELYRNRAAQTLFIQGTAVHQAYRVEKAEPR
ncbi:hypothetical protein [Deinococcus sp. UYEF24]